MDRLGDKLPRVEVNKDGKGLLAQSITLDLKEGSETVHSVNVEPSAVSAEKSSSSKFRSDAGIPKQTNQNLVIALMSFGMGATEASTIAGFLGLDAARTFGHNHYRTIEDSIGEDVIELGEEALKEALIEEIRLTCDEQGIDYNEWNAQTLEEKHKNPVKLTVGVDMGWSQRGSGRAYNSASGHAYLIGQLAQKPISGTVLSKRCSTCEKHKRQKKERSANSSTDSEEQVPEHDCNQNYDPDDSSGGMEKEAALDLVQNLYFKHGVAIGTIVADEDSSLRAALKWSYRELINRGVMKEEDWPTKLDKDEKPWKVKDTGRLAYPCPEPEFISDPQH